MLSLLFLIVFCVRSPAQASDHAEESAEKLSLTPFHFGADASIKPGFAAHAIFGWLPFKHFGFNTCGRTAYEEEGLYYEARVGPTLRFGKHGAFVAAPSFGFEQTEELLSLRTGAMLAFTEHDFETVATFEYGGATGFWYSTILNGWLSISDKSDFGAGAYAQGDEGFGPWFGGRFKHLSLWLAPVALFEDEQLTPGLVVGLELAHH